MRLNEILEEIGKRKNRWEKLAFIQMLMEQIKDEEILKKLAEIKKNLEKENVFLEPIRVVEAPVINRQENNLEELVETKEEINPQPLTELKLYGTETEIKEYTPLIKLEEFERVNEMEWEGERQVRRREMPRWDISRELFAMNEVFNNEDRLIDSELDEKIREDYMRRRDHG